MKTNRKAGKQFRIAAGAGALVMGACLASSGSAMAEEAKTAPKPAEPTVEPEVADYVNWVEFGVGGYFVKGDKAQFQQQKGVPAGALGGIESFHYEQPFQQKGIFKVDGRGILDNHDYDFKIELSHPDKGFVRAGYTEFRSYYDGLGGYLPSNGLIFQGAYGNLLAVDRTHAFFEAGMTLPDKPSVSFRYDLDTRDGTKDSTSWGTTALTPGGVQKKIVPSFRDLDETRHQFAVNAKHTLGNTEFGLGGLYEIQENQDQRNMMQNPNQGIASRWLRQDEGVKADLFNVHGFTDTKLNDEWEFTSGYSFSTLHSVLSGDRVDTWIATPTPLSTTDTRYTNLQGGSDLKQYVMNLNMMWSPSKDWHIIPSLRVEKDDLDGSATDNVLTGSAPVVKSPITSFASSDKGSLYVTEGLDIRYSGVTNWVFYGRAEISEDQANLNERFGANKTLPPTIFRETDWTRLWQKYAVGANWYPARTLNFGAQYYHKISDNEYTHNLDSTSNNPGPIPAASGDRYPAYLGRQIFDVDDVNFRVTWRPLTTLSFVTRYDFQLSRVNTKPDRLEEIESSENKRNMFGETVTWTPLNWLYVQGGGNYVLDATHSPVEELTGASSGVVLSSPNNYWTATGTLGFALDNKTDLQLTYGYYRADNYVDNSRVGMPYGSGAKQHEVSSTLQRQITRNLRWTLRYAFSSYRDETSGGALDYEAHGVLSSMQYRF